MILRSTQHKTIIARGDTETVVEEYHRRCEKFPKERFELVTESGEVVDVKDIEAGRVSEGDSEVRDTLSEDTGGELSSDTEYRTEWPADSAD